MRVCGIFPHIHFTTHKEFLSNQRPSRISLEESQLSFAEAEACVLILDDSLRSRIEMDVWFGWMVEMVFFSCVIYEPTLLSVFEFPYSHLLNLSYNVATLHLKRIRNATLSLRFNNMYVRIYSTIVVESCISLFQIYANAMRLCEIEIPHSS